MLFKITSTDGKIFFYDNSLTRFYDSAGTKIEFDYHAQIRADVDDVPYNKVNTIKHSNSICDKDGIRRLEIYVGYKCNYRCKYCIQRAHNESVDFNFNLFKQRFEASELLPQLTSIKLSGGECLVYWDRVQQFIKYFRDLGYDKHLQIATNGELFNDDICDFCLDHDIDVGFTHDSLTQTYYRHSTDYLDNPKTKAAVIRQLKARQLNHGYSKSGYVFCVLNPRMIDGYKAIDYLWDKLYYGAPVITYLISKYDSSNVHLMEYTPQSYEQLTQNLKQYYKIDPKSEYYSCFWRMVKAKERVKARLINEIIPASLLSRCPYQVTPNRLSVTSNGDALFCYAARPEWKTAKGHLGDIDNIVYNVKTLKDNLECLHCPYLITCGNPCPILTDPVDRQIRCKSITPLHRAMFESAVEELLGIDSIKEIKRCDQLGVSI